MKKLFTAVLLITALSFIPLEAEAAFFWGNSATFGPEIIHKIDKDTGALILNYTVSSGNGRGIVHVGDILYTTQVGDPNIYKTDANTGASLGSIFTEAASMSTLGWDGSHFWTTDYTGSNRGFQMDITGHIVKTLSFEKATGYMDGMEWFNSKLIVNRTDGGFGGSIVYDIYDLDGLLLQEAFITAPNGTGIAFDGTNFYVSNVYGSSVGIFDGVTGAHLSDLSLTGGSFLIEDLSFDYEQRDDTGHGGGDNTVPEPASMMLMGSGLLGMIGLRKKKAKA